MAVSSLQDGLQTTTNLRPSFSPDVTLEALRGAMASFAAEREWQRYHTPRNLCLALVGEAGELAELFQWRGDDGAAPGVPGWSARDVEHLGEELSDVLLYLVRLADVCGVDLAAAALRKMRLNAAKYPADRARGRSDKYTAYAMEGGGDATGGTAASASAATAPRREERTARPAAAAVDMGRVSCGLHRPLLSQSSFWAGAGVGVAAATAALALVVLCGRGALARRS
jgi:dCTP diphosphatase